MPSQRLVDRLKRERFRAVFDYLRRGSPAPVLNLLETVQVGRHRGDGPALLDSCCIHRACYATQPHGQGGSCTSRLHPAGQRQFVHVRPSKFTLLQDEPFMDTIDPEVRADIEYGARLLGRAIAQRGRSDLQVRRLDQANGAGSEPGLGASMQPGSR
jgi:hypothetical protein